MRQRVADKVEVALTWRFLGSGASLMRKGAGAAVTGKAAFHASHLDLDHFDIASGSHEEKLTDKLLTLTRRIWYFMVVILCSYLSLQCRYEV